MWTPTNIPNQKAHHMSHLESIKANSSNRLSTGVWLAVLVAAVVPMVVAAVPAQDEAEDYGATRVGESLFAAYCTSCHGATAEGNGPLASSLRVEPANLTLLRQSSGDGAFPFDRVVRKIDGTVKVKGHGNYDMPIWGEAFKKVDESATDKDVQAKVRALAHYVRSLQIAGSTP